MLPMNFASYVYIFEYWLQHFKIARLDKLKGLVRRQGILFRLYVTFLFYIEVVFYRI